MTKIFKGIGYLLGTAINGVFQLTKLTTFVGGTLAVSGVALAALTKPEEKSFNEFFDNFIKSYDNRYKTNTFLDGIIDTTKTLAVNTVSSKSFNDWFLWRVATVNFADGNKMTFIGTLKGWHNRETIKQLFKSISSE